MKNSRDHVHIYHADWRVAMTEKSMPRAQKVMHRLLGTSAKVEVSTVFLGREAVPFGKSMLFEMMVFGGEHDREMERYSTWDEAEAGHKKMCKKVGI